MPRRLLELDDVRVTYRARRGGTPKQALLGVGLHVDEAETVGLVGESGSGKTTLGNVVLGLQPVDSGRIVFDGIDISDPRSRRGRHLTRRIQVVFQDPYSSFNPSRTVGQSVAETLQRSDRRDAARRVGQMLERVGLEAAAATRYPGQFSGGQRQRIAVARALMPSPDLIICDEAVSALDLSVQAQVLNLLADLQAELGVAYLFITHDLAVVRHVCDRVVVMRNGEVVESGEAATVCEAPQHPYTQALVAAAPIADPDAQAVRRTARRRLLALAGA